MTIRSIYIHRANIDHDNISDNLYFVSAPIKRRFWYVSRHYIGMTLVTSISYSYERLNVVYAAFLNLYG